MSTDLEKLVVTLSADLKQYERALAKAQNTTVSAMRKMERDMQAGAGRMERALGGLGMSLKGTAALAVAGVVTGFAAMAKSAIKDAAAIGDLSDKIGVTSDKIQELEFGAVQANMSFEELSAGLLKFSKSIGQARNGQGDLLKTLEANGYDKARIKAMSYAQALDAVADLVKNAKTEQDAFLIITQAFGRGGDEFLEFLRNGSAGLKTYGEEAHKSGSVIEEHLIKAGQRFDDAWSTAILHIKKLIGDLTISAIDSLSHLNDKSPTGKMVGRFAVPARMLPPEDTDPLAGMAGGRPFGVPAKPTIISDPEDEARKKAAADQFKRDQQTRKDAIESVILALDQQIAALGKSSRQQAIDNELQRAGTTITTLSGQAIAAKAGALYDHNAALEAAAAATAHFIEQQQASRQQLEEMASVFQNEFGSAFMSVIDGTESVKDAFKSMAGNILQTITQLLLDKSLTMLMTMILNGGRVAPSQSTGIGGLFGRAGGGHVNAGQPYVVGEHRPEVFVPSQSGSITPRVEGSGGGLTIIDQRSNAPPVEARRQPNGNWTALIRDEINKTLGAGGADAAMGARFGMSPRGTRR